MTKNAFFTASADMKEEYCAKIVRLGELKPVEGADRLVYTIVDGFSIVLEKGSFEEGEAVIYCLNETQINKAFLAANNQFELGERHLNANAEEVNELVDEGKTEEAKRKVGFFNKHGRVKLIRLKGCPSYGCIFKKDTLVNWNKKLKDVNLDDYITVDKNGIVHPFNFDTVDGKLFAEAYVPKMSQDRPSGSQRREKRRQKYVATFNRLVPGQFNLHYDTRQLNSNIWKINPTDVVTVSLKKHGTSGVFANILTRIPINLSGIKARHNRRINRTIKMTLKGEKRFYWQRNAIKNKVTALKNSLAKDYKIGYGNVYSSRTVIKNKSINKTVTAGFYNVDIWGEYNEIIKPYLLQGMTVYGEICGYCTNSDKMIQKGYDYGCKRGENYLMPYRITFTDSEGNKTEWDVNEVYGWTVKLLADHPELSGRIKPIDILYHGTLANLYPDIDITEHWHENVLARMKEDTEHFGMEKNEPLCKNKVPREGIVIRIDGDETAEAFKLKASKFYERERSLIDNGEVDIEMMDAYTK